MIRFVEKCEAVAKAAYTASYKEVYFSTTVTYALWQRSALSPRLDPNPNVIDACFKRFMKSGNTIPEMFIMYINGANGDWTCASSETGEFDQARETFPVQAIYKVYLECRIVNLEDNLYNRAVYEDPVSADIYARGISHLRHPENIIVSVDVFPGWLFREIQNETVLVRPIKVPELKQCHGYYEVGKYNILREPNRLWCCLGCQCEDIANEVSCGVDSVQGEWIHTPSRETSFGRLAILSLEGYVGEWVSRKGTAINVNSSSYNGHRLVKTGNWSDLFHPQQTVPRGVEEMVALHQFGNILFCFFPNSGKRRRTIRLAQKIRFIAADKNYDNGLILGIGDVDGELYYIDEMGNGTQKRVNDNDHNDYVTAAVCRGSFLAVSSKECCAKGALGLSLIVQMCASVMSWVLQNPLQKLPGEDSEVFKRCLIGALKSKAALDLP